MSKKILKLLPVWAAIASVILIAGIVLMSLLGFNTAADRPAASTVEVGYDVSVDVDAEKTAALEKACEDAFAEQGISYDEVTTGYGMNATQDWTVRRYVFTGAERAKLSAARSAIENKLAELFTNGENTDVQVHETNVLGYSEVIWRGAVAVAFGAIVALIYLGIRYGVGCALTGLTASAVGGVLPPCIAAIARIPVYPAAPVFYAAIGVIATLLLWIVQCAKLRDLKKSDARPVDAEEAVRLTAREALPAVIAILCALVAVLAVLGGVATAGVRALVLPALLSVAAAAFSVLLFAPALHVHVKAAFDKLASKRRPRYAGKKSAKGEQGQEEA